MKTTEPQIQSLKEMINSCFAYGGAEEGSYNFKKYILPKKLELGNKLFKETYENQMRELKSCKIAHCVYTDSEGVTYNSIIKN